MTKLCNLPFESSQVFSYYSGIGFNVSSINLLLIDFTDFNDVLPFVIGSPVSIFWTALCIISPIFNDEFYSRFSYMPIAVYDRSFYDGLAYDPTNKTVHPFALPFITENSFFNNTPVLLIIFVIAGSKFKKENLKLLQALQSFSWFQRL